MLAGLPDAFRFHLNGEFAAAITTGKGNSDPAIISPTGGSGRWSVRRRWWMRLCMQLGIICPPTRPLLQCRADLLDFLEGSCCAVFVKRKFVRMAAEGELAPRVVDVRIGGRDG